MARFNINEADNYGAQKNNYFSLKDDGDTALVRFLYNDINDVEGVAVHEVVIDGKRRDVECIRAYNEPIDNCPLCAKGNKVNGKIFVPIYDESSKESKIWTRGKTYFNKLSSLCARYHPLVSFPFEIERRGKKGDVNTTYETFVDASNRDNKTIQDFPEINAEGIAFDKKTYEELLYYVNNGEFPQNVVQRGNQVNNYSNQSAYRETQATPIRRRPTYNNSEDTF